MALGTLEPVLPMKEEIATCHNVGELARTFCGDGTKAGIDEMTSMKSGEIS
jgi:hypothetical protein